MYRNHQIVSWPPFLTALETRFAPTAFDDPRGNLFKLTQSTTVSAYFTEFEAIANRLEGLSAADLLSCFVSSLKTEIRCEILALQPTTIAQAAGLAHLQEDKLHDIVLASRQRQSTMWQPPSNLRPTVKTTTDVTPTVKSSPGILPTPSVKPRFRHLSSVEMDERREKGLCFNCDQRWSRSHKCGARVFLLLANSDEASIDAGDLEQAATQLDSNDDP